MQDPLSLLNTASHHFENGQIKDAYYMFLNTAQTTIKPFLDVKFVHCSIISKPQNYDSLLCILRTCLDQIEKIVESHSISTNKAPPPLPPKPTGSKPVLPPKPTRALPTISKQASAKEISPIVPHGEIDPSRLVPAQSNSNDSLNPSANAKNIPNIPAPPLLTTHRVLQTELDNLELTLNDHRAQKRTLQQGTDNSRMTELNDAISKYTPYIAETKHTLNKIRTIYMSAATIPSILHFQPGIIAYQITRIESALFSLIPPRALFSHSPKTPHLRIVASTDFFNYITRLIEHSVLLPQEASSRAQHVHHWIKVAAKCQELNNYQTLKAIVSALGTPPVQRLKQTWAYIPKKSLVKLESLNELMSESNNYEKYREHMGMNAPKILAEHCKRPTVPFLGPFIHDMTYLLAAIQQRSLIEKDGRVQRLLATLTMFQSCPAYERRPTAVYAKTVLPKGPTRPTFSQAIHRSKSSLGRLGGAMGFGQSEESARSSEEDEMDLVTQYILMRPWISQETVDELSLLREPPQMKPIVTRSQSVGNGTGSRMSSTSSFMRSSTSAHSIATSLSTLESRPESFDEAAQMEHAFQIDSPLSSKMLNDLDEQITNRWDNSLSFDRVPIVPPRPRADNIILHKHSVDTDF